MMASGELTISMTDKLTVPKFGEHLSVKYKFVAISSKRSQDNLVPAKSYLRFNKPCCKDTSAYVYKMQFVDLNLNLRTTHMGLAVSHITGHLNVQKLVPTNNNDPTWWHFHNQTAKHEFIL